MKRAASRLAASSETEQKGRVIRSNGDPPFAHHPYAAEITGASNSLRESFISFENICELAA